MISFTGPTHRFNLRAASVILHNGALLLHRSERDTHWALPGGRVEFGETGEDAVVREMREELDEPVTCERLLWVVENFFEYDGQPHHEVGLYYLVRPGPESQALAAEHTFDGREGDLRLIFEWMSLKRLPDLDIRPSFLKTAFGGHEIPLRHIVHRGK